MCIIIKKINVIYVFIEFIWFKNCNLNLGVFFFKFLKCFLCEIVVCYLKIVVVLNIGCVFIW